MSIGGSAQGTAPIGAAVNVKPRLTKASLEAVFASETQQVFLILVEISHSTLASPIRIVRNTENITSNGNVYIAYPFNISLATEEESSPPRIEITIDNVARDILISLRSLTSPPIFTIKLIRAANPDYIEILWDFFELQDIKYNAFTISGSLGMETLLFEPLPAYKFTPAEFPGLF